MWVVRGGLHRSEGLREFGSCPCQRPQLLQPRQTWPRCQAHFRDGWKFPFQQNPFVKPWSFEPRSALPAWLWPAQPAPLSAPGLPLLYHPYRQRGLRDSLAAHRLHPSSTSVACRGAHPAGHLGISWHDPRFWRVWGLVSVLPSARVSSIPSLSPLPSFPMLRVILQDCRMGQALQDYSIQTFSICK